MKILGPNRVDSIPADIGVVFRAFGDSRLPAVITEGCDLDTATYMGLKTPTDLVAQAILSRYPTAMAGNYSASSTSTNPQLAFVADGTAPSGNSVMSPAPVGTGLEVFGAIITIQGSTGVGAPAVSIACDAVTAAEGAVLANTTRAANILNSFGNSLDNTISIRPPDLRGAGTFIARILWFPGYQVQGGFAYSPIIVRAAQAVVASASGNANQSLTASFTLTGVATNTTSHVTLLTRGCPEVDNFAASYLRAGRMQRTALRRVIRRG